MFVLIVLLVSVPAMFTQLYNTDFASVLFDGTSWMDLLLEDRAFLRAILYTLLTFACLSAMGRRGLAPVLTPINDFIMRYRWQALLLLGLIATYRMSDTVMGVMANVFYIDQGFTKDQIASVSKIFGLIMTLLGAGVGGLLIVRFGIMPILFIGGLTSASTNILFLLLADMGPNVKMLILTISLDNLSSGLATSAFVAYLSSLTNLKFSATQYALLSSIMLLLPRLLGGYSGVVVEKFGYHNFFLITALLGIPTLVMIILQWNREIRTAQTEEPKQVSPVDQPDPWLTHQGTPLDTENKARPFNPVPLGLISLGIWLPIIGAAFLSSGPADPSGSMAFSGGTVILAQIEIFAVIFLLLYAIAIKPWRLSRTVRTVFWINAVAAVVAAITIITTLARM